MVTNRVEHPITSGNIHIVAGARQLPAFWAYPETGGSYPGVAVLGDSLSAATRQLVNRLAQRGMYVLAPDLAQLSPSDALPAAHAALDVLRTHNHCNGSLALVGIGAGNALALHLHRKPGTVRATIAIQPTNPTAQAALHQEQGPLLVIYGGELSPEWQAFRANFTPTRGISLLVYAHACPNFLTTPHNPQDEQCQQYAWSHITAFLEQHLTWPRPAQTRVI